MCRLDSRPDLPEEAQEVRQRPMLHDFAIHDALDPQEHEAYFPARGSNAHVRPLVGSMHCHHTSDELAIAQLGLDDMVHIGEGGSHVWQMVTRFKQTGVGVEDLPIPLIEGGDDLAHDLVRSWC